MLFKEERVVDLNDQGWVLYAGNKKDKKWRKKFW